MSGFRSLHREQVLKTALWDIETTPLLTSSSSVTPNEAFRIWTASADGQVRSHVAQEASKDDASAVKLTCTHILGSPSALGCARVSLTRNYVGQDENAGDLVVVSLGLAGLMRVWLMPHDMDQTELQGCQTITPLAQFPVEYATGSALALCPPRLSGVGDVAAAVGCLDGTISIVAVGLSTPKATTEAHAAGTLLETWGSPGSAVPLRLAWHPKQTVLAVGRQNGNIDILSNGKNIHRLKHHTGPVRAVTYTEDGSLLIAGDDNGFLCVWDVQRKVPTLVHHVLKAHTSWIMDVVSLSKRFVTVGADHQIHVWDLGQMTQPFHTFQTDESVWKVQRARGQPRLAACDETGGLQLFSIEP